MMALAKVFVSLGGQIDSHSAWQAGIPDIILQNISKGSNNATLLKDSATSLYFFAAHCM
jgi:hypothetical protein